jgi:hypothetical protein
MTNAPILPSLPSLEFVQARFEQAEEYWNLARRAKKKAERAAYEDMARECIDRIRFALH